MNRVLIAAGLFGAGVLGLSRVSLGHGGTYRGPEDLVPPHAGNPNPGSPGPFAGGPATPGHSPPGPSTPGPSSPGGRPGPSTPGGGGFGPKTGGGSDLGPPLDRWQFWWEFNRDPFLNLKERTHTPVVVTGSDDLLGKRSAGRARDTLRPIPDQIQRIVVPLLLESLKNEKNREVLDSSMIALAKIGGEDAYVEAIAPFLKDNNTTLVETAAVSLGILAHPGALAILKDLSLDTPAGRSLVGRNEVPFRVRSFAVYGLGLLANAVADANVRQEVASTLLKLVKEEKSSAKDIRVGATICLGLFDDPEQDRALSAMLDLFDNRSEDELVRAHVPVAVAKALNLRGAPALLVAKCVEKFSKAIEDRAEKKERVKESCVLALGLLTDPKSPHYGDVVKVLERTLQEAPEQTQDFAAIALGFAGGDDAVKALRRSLFKGKTIVKPWAGLSLGVLAYRDRTSKRAEKIKDLEGIVEDLTEAMKEEKNPEHASAYALALGLAGDLSAHESLAKKMSETRDDESRGYFCLGLGLLGDQESRDLLHKEVKDSVREPLLLQQAAIGLGLLSDQSAVPVLLEILK
ncbi:MAG: HEAT repeat domain-containing protein, partial [Planctomycetota bacterium]